MGRLRFVALALECVLIGAGCDWSQWGFGASRIGANLEPVITTSNVTQMVPSTVAAQFPITGQAVSTLGLVFAQRNGSLVAYDSETFSIVWTAALPGGSTVGRVAGLSANSKTVFVVVPTATNPVLLGFDLDGLRNCNILDFS